MPGYDYSLAGYYAVTICTFRREYLLADIIDYEVKLFPIGEIAEAELEGLARRFPQIQLDVYAIMPNHIHFILGLPGNGASLPTIVRSLKSRISRRAQQHSAADLWQRSYFEHVIRSEQALERHRQYILTNPEKWELDELNRENWQKFLDGNPK